MAMVAGPNHHPLLERLEGVQRNGSQWLARCPAHDDRRPSLGVRVLDDGRVLVRCYAGCEVDQVVAAVGMRLADLFPESATSHSPGRAPRPRHDYRQLLLLVRREMLVVSLAAADVAAGRALSAQDRKRLGDASARIAQVAELAGE